MPHFSFSSPLPRLRTATLPLPPAALLALRGAGLRSKPTLPSADTTRNTSSRLLRTNSSELIHQKGNSTSAAHLERRGRISATDEAAGSKEKSTRNHLQILRGL